MENSISLGKYFEVVDKRYVCGDKRGKGKRVELWTIRDRRGEDVGEVYWHGPRRQYCFSPATPFVVFNADRLEKLAKFLRSIREKQN